MSVGDDIGGAIKFLGILAIIGLITIVYWLVKFFILLLMIIF
ncbi:MAG: hypothetical protein ACRCSY_07795 [Cetobacterium sp.]|nr:hypothetical protein CB452P1_000050 [Clostridium phage CB452P1]